MKKYLIFICLLLSAIALYADQSFTDTSNYEFNLSTDQYPSGIDWRSMETETFEVIYPAELKNDAVRILNMLEYEHSVLEDIIDTKMSNWKIILNNTYALPNGYVASAPEKSEFYSVPPQDAFGGTTEWYKLLTSHETFHMAQFDKLDSGFNKLIGVFTGESGKAVFIGLSVPGWYFEGDAVLTETLLTESGRGRQPDFEKEIKAILLNDRKYSYYHGLNNSYKDYYPGHYHHGYFLVSYIKMKYGVDAMNEILKETAKLSFIPLRFNSAVRKVTGRRMTQLHRDAMEYYKTEWEKKESERGYSTYDYLTDSNSDYTSYLPLGFEGNNIIALKASQKNINAAYSIDSKGNEKKISDIPFLSSRIIYKNKTFLWTEGVNDIRRGKRIYSDIFTANSDFKKEKKLTSKGYFYSPDLSSDGKTAAAVEVAPDRRHSIRFISTETGEIISSLDNPEKYVLSSPLFSDDGKHLVYIASGDNGAAVFSADLGSGEKKQLTAFSWISIKYPFLKGDKLFFVSPENGVDNIYSKNISTGLVTRITESRFGAGMFLVNRNNTVVFADYTDKGLKLAKTISTEDVKFEDESSLFAGEESVIKDIYDIEAAPSFFKNIDMANILPSDGKPLLAEENIPQNTYEENNYLSGLHLLNFHSWGFTYDSEDESAGFKLISNDIFNNLSLSLSGSYSMDKENYNFQTLLEYGGFFPIIKTGYRLKNTTVNTTLSGDLDYEESWRENTAILGMKLPFNLSSGLYSRELSLSATAEFTDYSEWESDEDYGIERDGFEIPVIYSIYFSSLKNMALRDLFPELGIVLQQSYVDTASSDMYSLLKSDASVYLPGLFDNHGIKVSGFWYKNLEDSSAFPPSDIMSARGYDLTLYRSAFNGSADYALPLFYPDTAIGSLAYLKRVYLNLFTDMMFETAESDSEYLYSAGCGFNFEMSFLSTPVVSTIKIRTLYNFDENKYKTNILFTF